MSVTVAVVLAGVVVLVVFAIAMLIDARAVPKRKSEDRNSQKGL